MEAGPLLIEVRCVPRRRWATLLLDDGLVQNIPRLLALQMVRMGELKLIGERPLTVSIPKHKDFAEELRHSSGRKIPGVSRPEWNEKSSMTSGLRCKPPREATNRDYVRTIGWVREAQKKEADKEDKKREREEARKKRKAKRKGRR